jgi:long-chain acyl-CoA synthetase
VPANIDLNQFRSLADLFEQSAAQYSGRAAYINMGKSITYAELDRLSRDFGSYLQHVCKLPKGARVALMMPNCPQYMVAIAGVLRAGMVVVNVNPLYTARELQHQLNDSGAEAIVILENVAHTLEEVIEHTSVRHVVLAALGDALPLWRRLLVNFVVRHVRKMVPEFRLPLTDGRSVLRFNEVIEQGRRRPPSRVAVQGDDIAFLQYTGGTTGLSKGATLLHRNVVANVLQTEAWFNPMLKKVGHRQLNIVCALPLYHIFALTVCYFMGLRMGGCNLLIPNPRDIPGLVKPRWPGTASTCSRRSTRCTTRWPTMRTSPGSTSRAGGVQRRRHGGAAGHRREVAQGHRLPGLSRVTACPKPPRWPPPTRWTCTISPARSACRSRAPRSPSAMTTGADRCRSANAAKSASAARR